MKWELLLLVAFLFMPPMILEPHFRSTFSVYSSVGMRSYLHRLLVRSRTRCDGMHRLAGVVNHFHFCSRHYTFWLKTMDACMNKFTCILLYIVAMYCIIGRTYLGLGPQIVSGPMNLLGTSISQLSSVGEEMSPAIRDALSCGFGNWWYWLMSFLQGNSFFRRPHFGWFHIDRDDNSILGWPLVCIHVHFFFLYLLLTHGISIYEKKCTALLSWEPCTLMLLPEN